MGLREGEKGPGAWSVRLSGEDDPQDQLLLAYAEIRRLTSIVEMCRPHALGNRFEKAFPKETP
jgi:hypothetical protein